MLLLRGCGAGSVRRDAAVRPGTPRSAPRPRPAFPLRQQPAGRHQQLERCSAATGQGADGSSSSTELSRATAIGKNPVRPIAFPGPDGKPLAGFEAGELSNPGVLLIQEWWGVTDIVKQQASLFASRGFRVLIPDLYKGKLSVDREEADHLLTSLDYPLAVKEIGCAARYLKETGSAKVGITGGCMGGALAFAAAQHVHELACCAPWYGTPSREMPWIQVEKIRIPVQYHTGMLDNIPNFSDPETGRAVTEHMKAAGCDIETFFYEDTPHSFLNALTPEGVAFLEKWGYGVPPPEQTTLCFERLVAFFAKYLKA